MPSSIGGILQFAVAAADLAVGAEVVALAEDQGQDELARCLDLVGIGPDDHAVQLTGRVQEGCSVRAPSTSTRHSRQPP